MRLQIARLAGGVEMAIIAVLLLLLGVVLAAGTGQLVVTVITDAAHRWNAVHSIDELGELRPVFSGFLLILIGLELMKTITMYLSEHVVHVEVVLTVAMIAVARHAIEIDYAAADAGQLAGTAALVLAVTAGYYLFRRSGPRTPPLELSRVQSADVATPRPEGPSRTG